MIQVDNEKMMIHMHGVSVSVHDIDEDTLQQIADLCEAEIMDRQVQRGEYDEANY